LKIRGLSLFSEKKFLFEGEFRRKLIFTEGISPNEIMTENEYKLHLISLIDNNYILDETCPTSVNSEVLRNPEFKKHKKLSYGIYWIQGSHGILRIQEIHRIYGIQRIQGVQGIQETRWIQRKSAIFNFQEIWEILSIREIKLSRIIFTVRLDCISALNVITMTFLRLNIGHDRFILYCRSKSQHYHLNYLILNHNLLLTVVFYMLLEKLFFFQVFH
jgi:hypothetical protein